MIATGAAPQTYSLKSVREMLGLSAPTLTRLIDGGFVTPARGPRNEYRFSFQDVVLLRTADQLLAAHIPPRKVVKALAQLRRQLPAEVPLSGLRISAVGPDVAVRQGGLQWAADSQQMLLDFEVAPAGGAAVSFISHPRAAAAADDEQTRAPRQAAATAPAPSPAADDDHGAITTPAAANEPANAEATCRAAIARDPGDTDARLNLGALLYEAGRLDEALAVYDAALARAPREPRLHYNRALALEDLRRPDDALAAYEACIGIAADFADAHFNAARLYEQLGKPQLALRHFSAYRRLQK